MQEEMAPPNYKGVYPYAFPEMKDFLARIVNEKVPVESQKWLNGRLADQNNKAKFYLAFAAAPQKVGKAVVYLTNGQEAELHRLRQSFTVNGWTLDRLCRVWLLLQLDTTVREGYRLTIEQLFLTADMNEQVALYSALPLLAFPDMWVNRCAEGIRSNIGDVLQAIMCRNPYPSERLPQPAWNQMVLKAFFTEKPVHEIVGLRERNNAELAAILSDYAHERWAAHRPVNPLLWQCVAPFVDEKIFPDILRIAGSENNLERMAAVLVCRETSYPPAKALLHSDSFLRLQANETNLSWKTIAQKQYASVE